MITEALLKKDSQLKHLKECIILINDLETNLRVVNIREIYNKEPLDFTLAGTLSKLGVVPKYFEEEWQLQVK